MQEPKLRRKQLAFCTVYMYTVHMRRDARLIYIDRASDIPAVQQIADNLRTLLVNGDPAPGGELPSVRRLAMELGVHFNTVAEAYRTLAAEGWLELRHGRTARVLARSRPTPHSKRWAEEFRQRMRSLIAQTRAAGASPVQISEELKNLAEELV